MHICAKDEEAILLPGDIVPFYDSMYMKTRDCGKTLNHENEDNRHLVILGTRTHKRCGVTLAGTSYVEVYCTVLGVVVPLDETEFYIGEMRRIATSTIMSHLANTSTSNMLGSYIDAKCRRVKFIYRIPLSSFSEPPKGPPRDGWGPCGDGVMCINHVSIPRFLWHWQELGDGAQWISTV